MHVADFQACDVVVHLELKLLSEHMHSSLACWLDCKLCQDMLATAVACPSLICICML